MTSESYDNSVDYILKNGYSFNYSIYYNKFCQGFSRQQTEDAFAKDLENALSNINCGASVKDWATKQIEYNYPALKTGDVDAFWEAFAELKGSITRSLTFQTNHQNQLNHHFNTLATSGSSSTAITINNNVVENDSKIIFNERSLGSILKSKGKELFARYTTLKNEEKVVADYCLNGILDLTNDSNDMQKKLFTSDEWNELKSTFTPNHKKYKLSKELIDFFGKLKKYIAKDKAEKAYNKTLIQITKATSDKFALKIVAHIVNAYNERGYIFTTNDIEATEYDYMAKIWAEVFELLFGDVNTTFIKWGESVSNLTTSQKKANDKSKQNVIGLKVDARFMSNINIIKTKLVDISNMEAAKSLNCKNKVYNDKSKLAIETKCILDNLVTYCEPQLVENLYLLNLQICGTKADVCSLKLVDSGVYVHNFEFDLTLPPSLELFSNSMIDWVRNLVTFKKSCLHIAQVSKNLLVSDSTQDFGSVFSREKTNNHAMSNSSWVRGTFFPPTNMYPKPTFPQIFLNPPTKRKFDEISESSNKKK